MNQATSQNTQTATQPQSIAVFGHKSPDTDAIVAAIVMSEWLNLQNITATPYRLGEINHETQFLLNLVKATPPSILTDLAKQSPIALVDHNESQQSLTNLAEYTIRYVIDHHKLGDLNTNEPTFIRFEPVGSTATILYGMYQEKNLPINAKIAMLMAGAVISDTLNLSSPTTTEQDRTALTHLLKIADITNQNDFANQLFEAKSDVSDLTAEQLVTADYKQFSFGKNVQKWGIASIETVKPDTIVARLDELQQAMQIVRQRDKLDFLLVIIVDILAQQSWAIVSDNNEQNQIVSQAFDSKIDNNLISLGKRVSRKKQFVPALESFYHSLNS